MEKYPKDILDMMTTYGFREKVLEIRGRENVSQSEAFERANEIYYEYFSKYRFSDYNTYKNAVSFMHNKQLKRLK